MCVIFFIIKKQLVRTNHYEEEYYKNTTKKAHNRPALTFNEKEGRKKVKQPSKSKMRVRNFIETRYIFSDNKRKQANSIAICCFSPIKVEKTCVCCRRNQKTEKKCI